MADLRTCAVDDFGALFISLHLNLHNTWVESHTVDLRTCAVDNFGAPFIFLYLNLHKSWFVFLQLLPPLFATSNLPSMRITRHAAKQAEKSTSDGNGSSPPEPAAQPSSENTKGTSATASKSKAKGTRKKTSKARGKQNQACRNADASVEPSETAHSSDKVDESTIGVPPKAKSPIPVSDLFSTEFTVILCHTSRNLRRPKVLLKHMKVFHQHPHPVRYLWSTASGPLMTHNSPSN